MRYVLVKDGIVVNAVEADTGWVHPAGFVCVADTKAQIGWSYDGVSFTAPPVVTEAPTKAEKQARVDGKIAALERKQARPIREATLGQSGATARLQAIEDQIATLRAERAAL